MMLKTTFGRCLYQSPSGLRVYQNACYRWLTFGNTILQTLIHRRHPERAGLKYILPLVELVRTFPGDCCLLGLGGGGIAHAISPILSEYRLIAVEQNEEVMDIAARYFMTDTLSHLTSIHDNAATFVQSATTAYQHILVDLHDANDFPLACHTDAFFAGCKARLRPTGILAVNLMQIQKNITLFNRIRQQFEERTIVIPVTGTTNSLVIALNEKKSTRFLRQLEEMSFLKSIIWNPDWGLVGQIKGA